MWGIINPQVEDTVEIAKVEQFLKDLTFIAISLPKSYYEHKLVIEDD
jgi:hypothetical protein